MDKRFEDILERWFLQEPVLFKVVCQHDITPNTGMECPLRCGKRRMEYNPRFTDNMTPHALEEALRTEAVRLLLKHPYERRPEQCSQQAIAVGSDIAIADNYSYSYYQMDTPNNYGLEKGMPYEWYSRKIQEMLPQGDSDESDDSDNSGGAGSQGDDSQSEKQRRIGERLKDEAARNRALAELWDEDEVMLQTINHIIEGSRSWGSLSSDFVEKLKASARASINWRNVFSGFRASILSSKRKLTRMRPSRRFGFESMGSTRNYTTRLLVAVDTSGSISSQSLSYFYGVINGAFKYGIETVDVVQCDSELKAVMTLKKAATEVFAVGRGGTDFQPAIDYAIEQGYDGLVYLTDGYAPPPVLPDCHHLKILWVCQNQRSYDDNYRWMETLGRVCVISLK